MFVKFLLSLLFYNAGFPAFFSLNTDDFIDIKKPLCNG